MKTEQLVCEDVIAHRDQLSIAFDDQKDTSALHAKSLEEVNYQLVSLRQEESRFLDDILESREQCSE